MWRTSEIHRSLKIALLMARNFPVRRRKTAGQSLTARNGLTSLIGLIRWLNWQNQSLSP
jgi:hypothetical protein